MHRFIASRASQRGITLVEMMIAMLLGLLLIAGISQAFLSNRQTYQVTEGMSRIQENGRFALEAMNFRIRMAGYIGCISEVQIYNNLETPDGFAFALGNGIEGFEASGTAPGSTVALAGPAAGWSPALPADIAGRVQPGSDVVVVRNLSAEASPLVPPYQQSAGIFIDADVGLYARGDILVATDCQKASVFQVADNPSQATGGGAVGIRLDHSAGAVTPGNAQPVVWGTEQAYGAGSELSRMETWVFYVGRGATGPALFQRRLRVSGTTASLVSEELVEGVDNMQILYGLDTSGDGSVDQYQAASGVTDWGQVASVRVALLLRAPEEYGLETDTQEYLVNGTTVTAPGDRRVRQVFSTSVAVRNRLP